MLTGLRPLRVRSQPSFLGSDYRDCVLTFFRDFSHRLVSDGCGLLDLVCLTDTLSTYPAFVSNRDMGFALTASHFAKAAK